MAGPRRASPKCATVAAMRAPVAPSLAPVLRASVPDLALAPSVVAAAAPLATALALATTLLGAGCRGNFDETPTPDAPVADAPPGLPAVLRGCELYLRFEEDTLGPGKPAHDECGGDDPGSSTQVLTTNDADRGKVAYFNGAALITVADAPRLRGGAAVTLSAWIRPTNPVGEPPAGVISKRTSFGVETAYTMFLWTGGHMWNDIDMENERIDVPVPIQPERWIQLGLVYDGSAPQNARVRTYLNGTRVGTFAESSARIPESYDAPVVLGYLPDQTDPNLYFKGMMDDAVIWSRALSDDEVAEWFQKSSR